MLAAVARHLSMSSRAAAVSLGPTHNSAHAGQRIADVPTPALLLDLDAMERNCAALQAALAPHAGRVRARPHAKAFKSSQLAALLPFERACCQTVREAEAMVLGGIMDVVVTNQVLGPKLARLAALAAHEGTTVGALVDAPEHVEALNAAATEAKVTLHAFVEINGGQNRCGVEGGSDESLSLAQAIVAAPSLVFGGLQCYHGAIQHVRDPAERRERVLSMPVVAARATVERLGAAGISCPIVSGGGTGTFPYELEGGAHNEIQPGSFLFMDGDYNQNEDSAGRFEQSLVVLATVISANETAGRRVLDAGNKACDLLSGMPQLVSPPGSPPLDAALAGVTFSSGGDEHGVLNDVPVGLLPLGAVVALVPSHCDPTVNQHFAFVGVRAGVVEKILPIDARGPGW
jgi:D-serine deaminase-like pyridoxal phosphate-dependent protein